MKRFTQQFHKEAQKISLSAREREGLLSRVESYMEYHPLPQVANEAVPQSTPLLVSEPMRFIRIPRRFLMASTSIMAMFLFVVVPAMAEQAMPGNILYPIKIHVNEEIRGSFLSGEERVRWETERVERRLAEARRLMILGKLTPEIEARVAESVTKQKNIAREQIITLETTDSDAATMATMAMASMFEVQEALMQAVREGEEDVPSELSRLLEDSKVESKAKGDVAVVSEVRLMVMIEQHATRAYEILLGLEKNLERGEKENITRRLNDIERTLGELMSDVVITEEEKLTGLRSIWGDLQKLISYMNSLREAISVEVENVVHMRLTYDERVSKLQDEYQQLEARRLKLERLTEQHPDNEILEKARFVLPGMVEKLKQVAEVSSINIRGVESGVQEVRAQLDALDRAIPAELWRTGTIIEEESDGEETDEVDTNDNELGDEVEV